MSNRIDRGKPQRRKTRRNKPRASVGGIVCHCGWGGKLGRQQRPGIDVDSGHPTDFCAGLEPRLLDRVDLPDVVGCLGLGADGSRALRSPGPVDSLALKGTLERARRGDEARVQEPEQLDADPPGSPGRVPTLELTAAT